MMNSLDSNEILLKIEHRAAEKRSTVDAIVSPNAETWTTVDINDDIIYKSRARILTVLYSIINAYCNNQVSSPDAAALLLSSLCEAGREAFEDIFSDQINMIKSQLRGLRSGAIIRVLHNRKDTLLFPWELLLCDFGEGGPEYVNFLGYRHVIFRHPASGSYPNFKKVEPVLKPRVALLANDELLYVREKKRQYLDRLVDSEHITLADFSKIASPSVDTDRRQRRLRDILTDIDLKTINFACCMTPDNGTEGSFQILFDESLRFDISQMRQMLRRIGGKPIVLFNLRSDRLGTKGMQTYDHYDYNHVFQWVDMFLESGAAGVITTDVAIPDRFAANFAVQVYQYLLEGRTIGQSLLQARRKMLNSTHNPLGLVYSLYAEPNQTLTIADKTGTIPTPECEEHKDTILHSWVRKVNGIPYTIEDGIHRDIVQNLEPHFNEIFHQPANFIDNLWILLSRPQDATAYAAAAALWKNIWAQDPGLPPFTMIELLAQKEYDGTLYKGYRDHVVHSLLVYLLGLYLYYASPKIQAAFYGSGDVNFFLKTWRVAALFHDIGYYLGTDSDATDATRGLLLRNLEEFMKNPLLQYAEMHSLPKITSNHENSVRRMVGSIPEWVLESFSDLRMPFNAADGHILDVLDDFVAAANLADQTKKRYCYRYDKYSQDTKTDYDFQGDDHGIISAMLLVGQYEFFERYVESTCSDVSMLNKLKAFPKRAIEWMNILPEQVKSWKPIVLQSAAAIASHNINVACWQKQDPVWSKASKEPYYLTLEQYRLSIDKTPLAWLLALSDTLQLWDRPSRTVAPLVLQDCSINHQGLHITYTSPDKFILLFLNDESRNAPHSHFRRLINELRQYMDDLDFLAEGSGS